MLLKLKKLLNKKKLFILVYFIFLYFLQFVIDIKTLLLVVGLFSFSIYLLFDFSLKEILFFVLLFVFSFEKGIRGWDLEVVAQGRNWWMYGYNVYYGLSLRTLITVTLFLISLPDIFLLFKNKINLKTNITFLFLIGFVFFSFVSTLFSSDYFLSFFGFLRILQALLLFFSVLVLFEKEKFKDYFFIGIVLILIFNSFVSFRQFINSGPLGLFLEDGIGYRNNGFFTTDGSESLYRTSGLIGHPTFFASYISMLISVCLGYLIYLFKKNKKMYLKILVSISLIIGSFAVYSSFVRSSWFTLFFMVILFISLVTFQNKALLKKINKNLYLFLLILILLFVGLFGQTFFMRILSSTEFLSDGSGVVRISLIQEAIKMTKLHPIFGVGLNLNPRMMNEQSLLPPDLRGFMFPVHNTFILFLAEIGIPGTISFILMIVSVIVNNLKKLRSDFRYLGVGLGVIAFVLNAQVHTLFNQDPSFDFLFILLGLLVTLKMKKRTQKNSNNSKRI